MSKMLDIQAWVGLVCVSSVCKSICDNSDSNMVNTHVYVKYKSTQKNVKIRVQKSVWQMEYTCQKC